MKKVQDPRELFDDSINRLAHFCETMSEITVPYLSRADAEEAREHLEAARASLRKLEVRFMAGISDEPDEDTK